MKRKLDEILRSNDVAVQSSLFAPTLLAKQHFHSSLRTTENPFSQPLLLLCLKQELFGVLRMVEGGEELSSSEHKRERASFRVTSRISSISSWHFPLFTISHPNTWHFPLTKEKRSESVVSVTAGKLSQLAILARTLFHHHHLCFSSP